MSEGVCDTCLQMNLADFSDNHWVTCFQDTAEQILGKKAEELGELKQNVSNNSLVKRSRALNEIPSHGYRVSIAIWDHTVLPATRHK